MGTIDSDTNTRPGDDRREENPHLPRPEDHTPLLDEDEMARCAYCNTRVPIRQLDGRGRCC